MARRFLLPILWALSLVAAAQIATSAQRRWDVPQAFGQNTSAPANEAASQFYLRYRASIPTATTLQQIVDHWSSDQRQDFNAAPAAERPDLAFVKSVTAATTNVKVVNETSTPNYATLDVQGVMDGKPVTSTIELVRENGVWKIASGPERWR